jgi:hypothetical protein
MKYSSLPTTAACPHTGLPLAWQDSIQWISWRKLCGRKSLEAMALKISGRPEVRASCSMNS